MSDSAKVIHPGDFIELEQWTYTSHGKLRGLECRPGHEEVHCIGMQERCLGKRIEAALLIIVGFLIRHGCCAAGACRSKDDQKQLQQHLPSKRE